MSGRAAIVSLRFNPAFIQHLIAYAKAVSELGMEAEFLLDPPYSRFPELVAAAPIVEFRGFPVSASWDCAILLNPAVNNRKLGLELKRSGTKILYVYHEPWHMSLDYLRNEGISSAARAILAHRMTVPVLRLADTVILESHFGLEIYRSGDFRHNPKAVYFPQIYDDDTVGRGAELISQKQFFSFIGNPCRAHGFDQYLAAIRHALSSGMDVRFLIASRFALPDSVHRDPLLRQNADRLEFRCGQPLNNDEMNRCYAESFCVWNLYRRSTQSGVLPKALMFGTPVIASTAGSFPEFVRDGANGRFADAEDQGSIWVAADDMRQNIAEYSENCRKTFLEAFYYKSWLTDLRRLLS